MSGISGCLDYVDAKVLEVRFKIFAAGRKYGRAEWFGTRGLGLIHLLLTVIDNIIIYIMVAQIFSILLCIFFSKMLSNLSGLIHENSSK